MITSKANAKIKKVRKLQESARERNRQGVFVAEGERIVSETPSALLQEVYVAESKKALLQEFSCDCEIVSDEVFGALSDTVHPQGVLAVIKQPAYTLADLLDVGYNPMQPRQDNGKTTRTAKEGADANKTSSSTIVLLDDIRDPGNLGTILRTSEAAGVRGVILSSGCVDPFNPKVVRSTMGSIFRVPFVTGSLPDMIEQLKEEGYAVYGTSLASSRNYKTIDFGEKTAVITGNEANGISPEVLKLTTENLKIPMQGKVESLNAAVSLAVILFHLT